MSEKIDRAFSYVLEDSQFVRKWVQHSGSFIRDAVFLIVIPSKLRQSVLKVAHDESEHSGVRNSLRVLRHFLMPHMKKDVFLNTKKMPYVPV